MNAAKKGEFIGLKTLDANAEAIDAQGVQDLKLRPIDRAWIGLAGNFTTRL